MTVEWVDVLLEEACPLTTQLQTSVRALALRLGSGESLRLTTSQNSQKASPYRTSPLKVLMSAAEQAVHGQYVCEIEREISDRTCFDCSLDRAGRRRLGTDEGGDEEGWQS